ncbi:MAG TPA: response regulator transcription factor [Gaiellaceae bacterium]|nr:response regulator transcription factor [Gaiellaceae bacterium]
MSTTVLLTEREPATRGVLERQLQDDGFELAAPGASPDLVLAADDADVERWRGRAPVIVIGPAEADPVARVRAFRRGCDDYLARPFHYDELVERMRAVLRRAGGPPSAPLVAGPVSIDRRTRVVTVGGRRVDLSQKEYDLLVRLATDPERVFTKAELLRDVWGFRTRARTRTVDAHASRLRRKLRAADPSADLVENQWGVGYRLLGSLCG